MSRGALRRPRLGCVGACVVAISLALPAHTRAQLSDPCAELCGTALVATGIVAATGAVVGAGRLSGGISTPSEGLWLWGGSFALVVGGGVALHGDGGRQERAIYSAALGSAVGAGLGLGLAVFTDSGDRTPLLASTLIAAGAGALVGGVYGALMHEDHVGVGFPSMSVSFSF